MSVINTGVGTHTLDLIAQHDFEEVATIGNAGSNSIVRMYDCNTPSSGFLYGISNSDFYIGRALDRNLGNINLYGNVSVPNTMIVKDIICTGNINGGGVSGGGSSLWSMVPGTNVNIQYSSGSVGIGTANPTEQLDVLGVVKATYFRGDGSLITGLDLSKWTRNTAGDIYVPSGKVGIASTLPTSSLDVAGTIRAVSYLGDGSQLTGISSAWKSQTTNTTNIYYNIGNVGIGTTNVATNARLEVYADDTQNCMQVGFNTSPVMVVKRDNDTTTISGPIELPPTMSSDNFMYSENVYLSGIYTSTCSFSNIGSYRAWSGDTFGPTTAIYTGVNNNYNGSASSTTLTDNTILLGDYVQIQMPMQIIPTTCVIGVTTDINANKRLDRVSICGSMTGLNGSWVSLYTNQNTTDISTFPFTAPITTTSAFQYFRIIAHSAYTGSTQIYFTKCKIFGTLVPRSKSYFVGIGTTTPSARLQVVNDGAYKNAFIVQRSPTNGYDSFVVDAIGNVGIGVTQPQSKLHVYGAIRCDSLQVGNTTNAAIPTGVIVMWSGAITAIPTGWALCDGTNGTPNLRDRFVIGAGTTYTVGVTGGSSNASLTTANIPSHTHTASAANNGAHSHYMFGNVEVNTRLDNFQGTTYNYASVNGIYGTNGWYYMCGTNTTIPNRGLTDTEPGHTHTITVGNTGSGNAFNILNPYYALAYIMKL